MGTFEFTPLPSQFAWTFGGAGPISRLGPGTALKLWTEDAFSGRLYKNSHLPDERITDGRFNPQTGPFHVEGAEPGDTLVLHIAELTPARDWGVSTLVAHFGGLTGTGRTATLQPPLPERTWIYQLDRDAGTVRFEAAAGDFTVDLPLCPMLGTVGVAPSAGEVRSSLAAGGYGGNLDTPEMRAGATCYLGVNVEGALFSVGDGHYRQGEGESCGTAVEGAMNTTLVVDLIKGGAPAWPRIENDDFLITLASARPLEDAWRISQVQMVGWLSDRHGLDPLDAYQLLSQISRTPLANVVNTDYTVATKVPKALLPDRPVFGGMHRRMREIAARL
ncbi:acetamidase/formamidase family protein [Streptomyces sp. HD]|uniref:acetamidase/formamidase family protein n=1 Tax=Streptomyces sp. HD TaxID=3020892 RepID=UPI00232D193C|nr:acetamidase/formamidase family protein [Streptomyces sp. HD]MDC0773767.1 acetamidase/formamidase family protein [Streptomyces sp. HD]